MKPNFFTTLFTLLIIQLGFAQNIKGKIIDSTTGETIPYANIKVNESENLVSNAEGFFTLSENNSSNNFKPSLIDVEINKSTGFTKQALNKVNTDLKAFSKQLISHPPQEFTDILCNYYSVKTKKGDKFLFNSKLNILKATVLKNEGRSSSVDDLEKTALNMMLQHLDSTKYYRAKSGLFGSRDTISLRKDFNKKKKTGVDIEINSQLRPPKPV